MDTLESFSEALSAAGFKVSCRHPYAYHEGLKGPCLAEGRLGPVPVKVVIFHAPSGVNADMLRRIAASRVAEEADLAVVISRGTPEIVRSAARLLGVLVLDEGAMGEEAEEAVESLVAEPAVSEVEAEEIFKSKILHSLRGLLGGVFGGRKVEYLGHSLAFLRLRCYRLALHAADVVPEALETMEASVCFETASGSLVEYTSGGLELSDILVRLGELEEESIEVVHLLARSPSASLAEIAEHVGSFEKARVIVELLAEFGLVEIGSDESVRLVVPIPEDYRDPLTALIESGATRIHSGRPDCESIIGLEEIVEKLDAIMPALGRIEEVKDFYYPIYVGVFRKYKDTRYIDVATIIDGITGRRSEDIEEMLAGSPAVFKLDSIIVKVARGSKPECRGLGTGSTTSQPQGSTAG